VPSLSLARRWALTPPFHPYQQCEHCETSRRFCLRDATVLRFRRRFNFLWHYPWLRLVAKSPGVTRRVALSRVLANRKLAMPQDGVRTFLPLLRLAAQQPAITRPARFLKYTLQVQVSGACTISGGNAA